MAKIKEIKLLDDLSYQFYEDCKMERKALFKEEYDLEVTPLGEMEVFIDFIAGIVNSIFNGDTPKEHLRKLTNMTLEKGIPNLAMIKKYPLIFKYVQNWEKLRLLCIEYLEQGIRTE